MAKKSTMSPAGQRRIKAIKDAGSVNKALRIAASNDGSIGKHEYRAIQKAYNAGSLKIQSGVNSLNDKYGKKNGFIGYKSNVWNNMNKGRYDTKGDVISRLYGGIMDDTLGSGFAAKYGLGTRLNRNFRDIDKGLTAYTPTGVPTQYRPTALNKSMQSGWSMYSPEKTASKTASSSTGGTELQTGYTPTNTAIDTSPDQVSGIGMMSGGGAGINSAMGIRRKKSSWSTAGLSTKGTSSMNRGLTINSFNV